MPESAPRIFVSYSRANRDFARDLYQKLEALGYSLWRDLHDLEPGKGWWPQIQEAIEGCRTMILCMSPQALVSSFVTDEWRYARQLGRRVIPVVAADVDFAKVPHWMGKIDWLDFRAKTPEADLAWQRLLSTLNTEYIPRRVPFTVPPELYDRGRYVDRPAEYAPLKAALLSEDRQNPVAITTVLHGSGGFGKTTLAAALCHDNDILSAFDDGILWVSLGQTPDLARLMGGMYRALTGDEPGFKSADEAAPALAERLKGRDCLLVVDDVWNHAHVKPFLKLGDRSACLVTTRQFQIAVEAGAVRVNVDEMTTDQAVRMLVARLEPPPADLAPFRALAVRLGEWPLLLEIANGMLRVHVARTQDTGRALEWVNKALDKRGVTGIVREDEEERKRGAADTLAVSIALLEPEEQTRYRWLAIFPEEAAVPLSTLQALWGLDDFDTEEQVKCLADLSLLRWDAQANTIRLHDVVRKTLEEQLGQDAPCIHARLLDAWGKGWEHLPDDYAWNHYTYHLHGADRDEELRALFADQRWMKARFAHDNYTYSGFSADVVLALEQAAYPQALSQLDAGQEMAALADCVRFALIRTSINSLAGNYLPAVVAGAVATGLWSHERALSMAGQVPDPQKRAEMYLALVNAAALNEQQHSQAVAQALTATEIISDEIDRAEILKALGSRLVGEQVSQAFAIAQNLEDEKTRSLVLRTLTVQQASESVEHGLEAALAIQDEESRGLMLMLLADRLTYEQVGRALAAALAIEDEESRGIVLIALAPKCTSEQLEQALAAIQTTENEEARVFGLIGLADNLEGEQVAQALAAAQAIQNEEDRALVVSVLCGDPINTQQAVAPIAYILAVIEAVQQEVGDHIEALGTLADRLIDRLAGDLRVQALGQALALLVEHVEGAPARTATMNALVGRLTVEEAERVLTTVTQIVNDGEAQALLVGALADRLTGDLRKETVGQALRLALSIQGEASRSHVLSALASKLDNEQVEQVLAATEKLQYEDSRADVLSALASRLNDEQVERALKMALVIETERYRASVLSALVSKLGNDQVEQVLEAAQAMKEKDARAEVVSALAIDLSGEIQKRVLEKTLSLSQTIQDETERVEVLCALADNLVGEGQKKVLWQALTLAQTIQDEEKHVNELIRVDDRLTGEERTHVIGQALSAVLTPEWEALPARLLSALASRLDHEQVGKALASALAIQHDWIRANALSTLASKLEGEQVEQVLESVQAMRHGFPCSRVLVALADKLEGAQIERALGIAQTMPEDYYRAEVLSVLASKLERGRQALVLDQALAVALAIDRDTNRVYALAKVAGNMEVERRAQVLDEALTVAQAIPNYSDRTYALCELADQLDRNQVDRALAAALSIQSDKYSSTTEKDRAEALGALAGRLERKQVEQALASALTMQEDSNRANVLCALANNLEHEQLEEVLAVALTIQDEKVRARVLTAIANRLQGMQLEEALAATYAIQDEETRTGLLNKLADRLGTERHRAYLNGLLSLQHVTRTAVLSLCAESAWYTSALVQPETVFSIAQHVHEICNDWQWM